jgi:hypothetical protein
MPAPPPGYTAYGVGNQGAFGPSKPVGGLAKWIVMLQAIFVAISVISVVILLGLRSQAREFIDGTASLNDFEDAIGPFIAIGLVLLAAGIAYIVLLIIWSYRISSNLRNGGRATSIAPGATIALNLIGLCIPPLTAIPLFEQWKASDPAYPRTDQGWKRSKLTPMIPAYLGLLILSIVLSFASGRFNFGGSAKDVAEQIDDALAISAIGTVASIAASILLIFIVRQLTARHKQFTGEA